MLPTPKKYKFALGSSEGETPLSAFDGALLKAGIGNINLIRVTSILPPFAEEEPGLIVPEGSLVPTAYGTTTSDVPDQVISAAIGIGYTRDSFGVIMERSGKESREKAEATVKIMLEDAFKKRGALLENIIIKGIEYRVKHVGAVIAAVV
ncbi:MAG: arginine decarboxylase, pyruvoyl-dependent, partial [Dethiobacteria bacterium]